MLVFKSSGHCLPSPTPPVPPENEHVCSFSRAVAIPHTSHSPRKQARMLVFKGSSHPPHLPFPPKTSTLSDTFLVWTQIRPNTLSYQNITFHLIVKPIHDTHVLSTTHTHSKTMFTIILFIIAFTLGYVYANATRNNTSQTSQTLRTITTTSNYYDHCKNVH